MEGDKEISPMGFQLRTLIGATLAFGKNFIERFGSYLDTKSYLAYHQLEESAESPGPSNFSKKARREKARSSRQPPAKQPINSKIGKRRDSTRPSSPPRGCVPNKALRK